MVTFCVIYYYNLNWKKKLIIEIIVPSYCLRALKWEFPINNEIRKCSQSMLMNNEDIINDHDLEVLMKIKDNYKIRANQRHLFFHFSKIFCNTEQVNILVYRYIIFFVVILLGCGFLIKLFIIWNGQQRTCTLYEHAAVLEIITHKKE